MTDVHVEEHSSLIKTPQQLIVVVLLSFIVPLATILLIVQLITGGLKVDPDSGIMMVMMENLSAAFSSQLLSPVAQVAQASDGAIYVSEPGASSFSVIRPRY